MTTITKTLFQYRNFLVVKGFLIVFVLLPQINYFVTITFNKSISKGNKIVLLPSR